MPDKKGQNLADLIYGQPTHGDSPGMQAGGLAKALRALTAAEKEANKAKFLEPSKTQMRLYHGTTATEGGKGQEAIRRIKPSKEGSLGSGVYLTPSAAHSSTYSGSPNAEAIQMLLADKHSADIGRQFLQNQQAGNVLPGQIGGNMLPVYAQVKNPLILEGTHADPMIEALVKLGMDEDKAARMVERAYENKGYIGREVENRARAAGYDGLMQYRNGDLSEVVVYNPNAVKSAIGNQGTYDITKPGLSEAEGGAIHMDKGGAAFGVFPQMKPRRSRQDPEAAKQVPVDLARGFAAGALGMPGDVESLIRLLPGLSEETILPTSEDILKRIPGGSDTPASRAASGLGILGGGFYTGPGSAARAVSAVPGAVKRAAQDFAMAAAESAPKMFIGPKAKTWDKAAADAAERLEKAGMDPVDIWRQTGTFRGADGILRQEISDVGALHRGEKELKELSKEKKAQAQELQSRIAGIPGQKDFFPKALTEARRPARQEVKRLTEEAAALQRNPQYTGHAAKFALEHPELYAAYPELADVKIVQGGSGGPGTRASLSTIPGAMEVDLYDLGLKSNPRSSLLHEMQHAVQTLEGMGPGGNPALAFKDPKAFEILQKMREEISKPVSFEQFQLINKYPENEAQEAYAKYVKEKAANPIIPPAIDRDLQQQAATEYYRRLSGEAEARATQAREPMGSTQRRQEFPYSSYDVLPEDLIVKEPKGSTLQASIDFNQLRSGGVEIPASGFTKEEKSQLRPLYQQGLLRVEERDGKKFVVPGRGAWYEFATPEQQSALNAYQKSSGVRDLSLMDPTESLLNSAQASFFDFEIVPGVRNIPIKNLEPFLPGYESGKELKRIEDLAGQIKESKQIEPLFIGLDPTGVPYIMEGQHRIRALKSLGYDEVPARVVVDMDEVAKAHGGPVHISNNPDTMRLELAGGGGVDRLTPQDMLYLTSHPDFAKMSAQQQREAVVNMGDRELSERMKGKMAGGGTISKLAKLLRAPAKTKQEIEEIAERMAPQVTGEYVREKPKSAKTVAGKTAKQFEREKNLPVDTRATDVERVPEKVDVEKLKDQVAIGIAGDPTVTGKTLYGVGETRLASPAPQHGGPLYGLYNDEGQFWASGLGAARKVQNLARQASQQYDAPVLGNYVMMGPDSINYAQHFADANLQAIDLSKMTAKQVEGFNDLLRQGSPKSGPRPSFPGIEDKGSAYLHLAFDPELRKYFNQLMQQPTVTEKFGLPSGQDIRFAITEPELQNLERGVTGFSLGRMNPEVKAKALKLSEHPTYSHDIPGEFIGQTKYPIPYELSFPDTLKAIRENPKQAPHEFGSLKMVGPRQIIDQQLIDEIKAYEERMKALTGKKKGGAIKKAPGGEVTVPDMTDGGKVIDGGPFKKGGKVQFTDNLDTMRLAVGRK